MHVSVRSAWLRFNEDLEGRMRFMYCDPKGLVRTGVGNLVDATRQPMTAPSEAERATSHGLARGFNWLRGEGGGASADGSEVDAAWDAVKARMDLAQQGHLAYKGLTELRITDDEINRFVFEKLDQMEGALKRRPDFARYEDWPADAQMALLSMSWAMGPAFGFPKFRAFALAGDFAGCARECRINPDVGTIGKRNDRDQLCFRNAAEVAAAGLDREALFWPGAPEAVVADATPTPKPAEP